jgi:VIT1/CCC1 family predicted Fe2+/Mn2+ transporter
MGTSPFSPDDIRAAAGAHHELGPEYSEAVVASFLEKVDQEIAARVAEHLAASTPRSRPVPPENRRALVKGFAMGVAASVAAIILILAARPGHHALALLPVLAVVCGAAARWAQQQWASRRAAPRPGPRAADGGDYRRLI